MKNYRVYLNEVSRKSFFGSFFSRTAESIATELLAREYHIVPETQGAYWETMIITR